MSIAKRRIAALFATLLAACNFHTSVPAGARISCQAGQSCPSGFTCRPALGQCVPDAELGAADVAVTDLALSPSVGNAQTTFTLTFQVSRALAKAPEASGAAFQLGARAQVTTYPWTCQPCGADGACACQYTPSSGDVPPDGPLTISVSVVDTLGTAAPDVSAGTILIDDTPPVLSHPTVDFTAAPGILVPVDALGHGDAVRICAEASESLQQATLTAQRGSATFALDPDPEANPVRPCFDFTYDVDGGAPLPDGDYTVTAHAVDLAGNASDTVLLDGAQGRGLDLLDTPAPPPGGFAADGGFFFHRAPWGEVGDGGALPANWHLRVPANPFGQRGTLFVYGDPAEAAGLAAVALDGGSAAFDLAIPGPDRPTVWLDFVDRAGYRIPGGPFRVRDGEWVATLGGKVAGDTRVNPNVCFDREADLGALFQANDGLGDERGEHDGPGLCPGCGSDLSGGVYWRRRGAATPQPDETSLMAADVARGQALLLGGAADGHAEWLYDGEWGEQPPTGVGPGYRVHAQLAFDEHAGRYVLFGGVDSFTDSKCDTWLWDGAWVPALPCELKDDFTTPRGFPTARRGGVMAYDPDRQRTVLMGGIDTHGTVLSDPWAWDGASWSPLADAPDPDAGLSAFPPRYLAAMTFWRLSDGGGALLLVGGAEAAPFANPTLLQDDTWLGVWADGGYAWAPLADPGCGAGGPACVPGLALAVDPGAGSPVLAVGDPSGVQLWAWADGGGWALGEAVPGASGLVGLVALPAVDGDHPLVLEAQLAAGASADAGAAWGTWHCGTPAGPLECLRVHQTGPSPPPRRQGRLAFDAPGSALLTGGQLADGTWAEDAWRFDGVSWAPAPPPRPRSMGTQVVDPDTGTLYVVGGGTPDEAHGLFDLERLLPDAGWSLVKSVDHAPEAPAAEGGSYVTGAAWVSAAGDGLGPGIVVLDRYGPTRLLTLFGDGGYQGRDVAPRGPDGAMGWDPGRRRLWVVVPGYPPKTWALDPPFQEWKRIHHFYVDDAAVMDYDESAASFMFFGPADNSEGEAEVVSDDGDGGYSFDVLDPYEEGPPGQISDAPVAYDPSSQGTFLFGGSAPDGLNPDLWELTASQVTPAEVCRFALSSAQLDPGTPLQHLAVTTQAGTELGRGDVATASLLSLWQRGSFRPVATCEPGIAGGCSYYQPGALGFDTTDPTVLREVARDDDTLGVSVRPALPNGQSQAEVKVSRLQVTVGYELPEAAP